MGKARYGATGATAPRSQRQPLALLDSGRLSYGEKLVSSAQKGQEMANMLVHDLKGPLAEIIANLDLLCDLQLEPYYRECLDAAVFGAESLHRMILDILDVARLEDGKLKIIPETVSLAVLAKASARGLDIKINLHGGPAEVTADGFLMGRVITNFLLNAIEHTPEGSTITVVVDGSTQWAELSVGDSGSGIPEEILPKVFDKYASWAHRGAGKRRGTGLGLCFSKMAVEAHGGQIFVESKPGAGSKFGFRLPAKQGLHGEGESTGPDDRG